MALHFLAWDDTAYIMACSPNVFTEIVNDIPNRMTALRAIEPDKGREWAMILHPNGRAYWYHEADSQRTVLDMEIIDGPQFLAAIEARRMLWQLARPAALDPPSKEIREPSELTLRRGKQQHTLEYYFTDWTRRSLGWVHVTESSRGVGCLVNEVGTTLGIPGNPSGKWVLLRDAGCPEKDGALVATICELEFWKHVARYVLRAVHRQLMRTIAITGSQCIARCLATRKTNFYAFSTSNPSVRNPPKCP